MIFRLIGIDDALAHQDHDLIERVGGLVGLDRDRHRLRDRLQADQVLDLDRLLHQIDPVRRHQVERADGVLGGVGLVGSRW